MELLHYTIENGFLPHLKCGSLDQALGVLAQAMEAGGAVASGPDLLAEVKRREQEGSTAVGGGLVIPHARFGGATKVRLALATLAEPLAIPTEDGRPVDIVILLVGPDRDPRQMLRVLARIARLVRHGDFLDDLRLAADPRQLQTAFARALTDEG